MNPFINLKKIFSFDKQSFNHKENGPCKLSELTKMLMEELKENGQERTAKAYQSLLNNILDYTGGRDIYMENITEIFLLEYELHLRKKNKTLGTISFYMRNLRAIYNKGLKKNLYYPFSDTLFDRVYTSVETNPEKKRVDREMKIKSDKQLEEIYKRL